MPKQNETSPADAYFKRGAGLAYFKTVRGPVVHDPTPVHVRGEELDEIWWQGRQWAVTRYGIECRDGSYAIPRRLLWQPDWEPHLAEKGWVDIPDFRTAYLVACALHGVRVDDPRAAKHFSLA